MAAEQDATVLSFHDSLLRESDIQLLSGPYWLNDRLIGFVFEYLEKVTFSGYGGEVAYISPDVTQFIKLGSEAEMGIFLEPLDLATKNYVFLAVNSSDSCDTAGGDHWSLLVYNRPASKFLHLDSLGGNNVRAARDIAQKLKSEIKHPLGSDVEFEEMNCPRQQNTYDCGVYVICFAEQMSRILLEGTKQSLRESISPAAISTKRREIKDLIMSLANKTSTL